MSAPNRDQLGRRQRSVLKCLADRAGVWFDGCGWYWNTRSTTVKILDSLVRRGLVEAYVAEASRPAFDIVNGKRQVVWVKYLRDEYRITDDGRLELSAEARR